MLNIRLARVRSPCGPPICASQPYLYLEFVYAHLYWALNSTCTREYGHGNILQVEDLTAMQACNLQNLPENYTMRYCTLRGPPENPATRCLTAIVATRRSLLSPLAPTAFLRGGRGRTDRRIHPRQNVSVCIHLAPRDRAPGFDRRANCSATDANIVPRAILGLNTIARDEDGGEEEEAHGHVVSISVLRSYRRLGLAKRLMIQSRTSIRVHIYVQCF